jgi:Sigma-70, region 4
MAALMGAGTYIDAVFEGATYQIIGDALGLSKQRVHQIALDAA